MQRQQSTIWVERHRFGLVIVSLIIACIIILDLWSEPGRGLGGYTKSTLRYRYLGGSGTSRFSQSAHRLEPRLHHGRSVVTARTTRVSASTLINLIPTVTSTKTLSFEITVNGTTSHNMSVESSPQRQVPTVLFQAASCPNDTVVVVRTGMWSTAGQRLGNTLCMLGAALVTADKLNGALELTPPGTRYYNTTRFCTSRSTAPRNTAVIAELFHCYTPCTCGNNDFFAFRRALQRFVLPNFFVTPRRDIDPNTLVIHIRSGDILTKKRGVKYWQPPLKFYKYIITRFHRDSPIIICTEIHDTADGVVGGNPVVEELLKWRPTIQFDIADLESDVATLLSARYLVQATSSFSNTLSIMNPHLRTTYVARPVASTPRLNAACCGCDRSVQDGQALPKEWRCGAERGWPQPNGESATIVQVLLPGYSWKDLRNFTQTKLELIGYDGPICHKEFPETKH
eukprot:m.200393 g.200393  ORF g.200393 m.200393 type:complete len:455 (+) comp32768_c0_seq1:442-1806(+)